MTLTTKSNSGARVGHVHLRVADRDRSIAFYCDILGFDVTQRYGAEAAFLGAGGYHHHIGLNTWDSAGGTPPPAGHTGLFHSAFLYPDRTALAQVAARVVAAGIQIAAAADHGVSEALFCATRIKTASNFILIATLRSGPATPTAASKW